MHLHILCASVFWAGKSACNINSQVFILSWKKNEPLSWGMTPVRILKRPALWQPQSVWLYTMLLCSSWTQHCVTLREREIQFLIKQNECHWVLQQGYVVIAMYRLIWHALKKPIRKHNRDHIHKSQNTQSVHSGLCAVIHHSIFYRVLSWLLWLK